MYDVRQCSSWSAEEEKFTVGEGEYSKQTMFNLYVLKFYESNTEN